MLGICYTCVALCCSAYGFYAVECGVARYAAQHTAIANLTVMKLMVQVSKEGIFSILQADTLSKSVLLHCTIIETS